LVRELGPTKEGKEGRSNPVRLTEKKYREHEKDRKNLEIKNGSSKKKH